VALNMKPKQAIGHGNNGRLTTGDFNLETLVMGRLTECQTIIIHRYIILLIVQAMEVPGPML
jgi:hypothetical protein